MSTIYCFGEALIDFCPLPPGTGPAPGSHDTGAAGPCFRQCAGGAPANAAVAAALLAEQVEFVGGFGNDGFATFLRQELRRRNVGLKHAATVDAPTALAFVHLDENNDRSFSFRRQHTADLLYPADQAAAIPWAARDILHLCSNLLMDPSGFELSLDLARRAQAAGALVSLDVNFRPRPVAAAPGSS